MDDDLLADNTGGDDAAAGADGADAAGGDGSLAFGDAADADTTVENQVIAENLGSKSPTKKRKSRGKTKDAYVAVDDYEEDDTAPTSNDGNNVAGGAPTQSSADQSNEKESTLDDETPVVGNKNTTEKILWEKTANELVKSVVNMANWACTSLLTGAVGATIAYASKGKATETTGTWVYFWLIFALAYGLCILEHMTDDPKELADELNVTMPERLAREAAMDLDNDGIISAEERRFAMKKLERAAAGLEMDEEMKKEEERHRRGSSLFGKIANKTESVESMQAAWKVCQMVEVEVNAFSEAFAELMIATLANMCSMALNSAMLQTITNIEEGQSESMINTSYAVLVSYVACVWTVRSSRTVEKLEKELFEQLEHTPYDQMKDLLIKFAAKRRVHTLITTALGFSIGYAWRQVFLTMEKSVFGEGEGSSWHDWIFALELTAVTAFFNTLPLRYSMFIPRNERYTFQPGSKERELLSGAWMSAIKLIVGLQWTYALNNSLNAWAGASVTVALLWISAILLMFMAMYLTQLWERYEYTLNAKVHGAVYTVFEMFNKFRDPDGAITRKGQTRMEGNPANDDRIKQQNVGYTAVGNDSHQIELAENKEEKDDTGAMGNELAPNTQRDSEQHIETDSDFGYKISFIEESSWMRDYTKALIVLLLGSMSVAAGKTVYNATNATINLTYKGFYDPNSTNDDDKVRGKYVVSVWIACAISLFVWTGIVMYLAALFQKAKEARRKAFEEIKQQMDVVEGEFQKTITEIKGKTLR